MISIHSILEAVINYQHVIVAACSGQNLQKHVLGYPLGTSDHYLRTYQYIILPKLSRGATNELHTLRVRYKERIGAKPRYSAQAIGSDLCIWS